MRDQVAPPALCELDGAVDAADVDHDEADQDGDEDELDVARDGVPEPGPPARDAPREVPQEHPEEGHGGELEDDAALHDVCAAVLLLVCVGHRGHRAADGLNNQRDDVARAEDDGVPLRGQDGGGSAEVTDEFAEEDVERRAEEDGGDDESNNLG